MRPLRCPTLVAALLVVFAQGAAAHTTAASHLTFDPTAERLTVDLALPDVAQLVPLQSHADGSLRWGAAQEGGRLLAAPLLQSLSMTRGGSACTLSPNDNAIALRNYSAGLHLSLQFAVACDAVGDDYVIGFTLFETLDPGHRALFKLAQQGSSGVGVITAEQPRLGFSTEHGLPAGAMLTEGIHHILSGYDHLLFLLLLVLPAVAGTQLRQRLLHLGGIVTAFTAAHSITLALAATGVLALPAAPVEIAIAASIVVAGAINVVRPGHRIGWKLAAGFGLLHGFGFAGALSEIGLGGENLALQLLAFNAGVELGQLAVVGVALPLLVGLAVWRRYRSVVVPVLSAAGAGLGVVWMLARL